MPRTVRRPQPTEHDAYYQTYVDAVPDGEIVDVLRASVESAVVQYAEIPADQHDYAYEPGKWTTREVIQHVVDAEWVFSYRALRFARGDETPLPGMDQDVFMAGARFQQDRPVVSLLKELLHLRQANCELFDSFDDATLDRTGVASDASVSVRALLYIIAGHALHHWRVLDERYLSG